MYEIDQLRALEHHGDGDVLGGGVGGADHGLLA